MGARFGYDLSEVRIHTGPEADTLNHRLGAAAFTIGSDIFFGRGEYDPGSPAGLEVIAHELVHVVQQDSGRATGTSNRMTVGPAKDPLEREADRLARLAVSDSPGPWPSPTRHGRHNVIQRSRVGFASRAREAIHEADLTPHDTRCHAAVLYWMFRELGDTRPVALAKLRAISEAKCPAAHIAVGLGAGVHIPLTAQWFFNQFYWQYDEIVGRNHLADTAAVGDVFVTGHPSMPNHSMVVVTHRYTRLHSNTNIRGFNNSGTFGRGRPNTFDATERHCDVGRMWHGNLFGFARPGLRLFRVTYDNYAVGAQVIRGFLNAAGGGNWTYNGP
jgi:hypothetical protein